MGKHGKRFKPNPTDKFKFFNNLSCGNMKQNREGKTHITANRLTIPQGFLRLGVKSQTAKRHSATNQEQDNILSENLHGLFANNCNKTTHLRRSERISEKYQKENCSINYGAADYYLAQADPNYSVSHNTLIVDGENPSPKPFSKSLFREILSNTTNRSELEFQPISSKTFYKANSYEVNDDFNLNLLRQIDIKLRRNPVEDIKVSIFEEIQKLNDRLSDNRSESPKMEETRKRKLSDNLDNEQEEIVVLCPQADWCFNTPTNQKQMSSQSVKSELEPAFIYSYEKGRNVYQLNENINVDLTHYVGNKDIPINNKYMRQIATFGNDVDDYAATQDMGIPQGSSQGTTENKKFNFNPTKGQSTRENVSKVPPKPRKTSKRLSQLPAFFEENETADTEPRPSTSAPADTFHLRNDFEILGNDENSNESPQFNFKIVRRFKLFNFGMDMDVDEETDDLTSEI